MLNITATGLRGNLFAILKRVESGEKVVITHKKKVVYLKSFKKSDWRKKNTIKPKLLVSPDELIKPVEDFWKNYI